MEEFKISREFLITIVFVLTTSFYMSSCKYIKEVTVEGEVISHATTADRYGYITYHTIAKFNDGTIKSITGLKYYVIPVNGRMFYTIRRFSYK